MTKADLIEQLAGLRGEMNGIDVAAEETLLWLLVSEYLDECSTHSRAINF